MPRREKHHAWPSTLSLAVACGLVSRDQAEELWQRTLSTAPDDALPELRREAVRLGWLSEAEFDYLATLAKRGVIVQTPAAAPARAAAPSSRWSILRTILTLSLSLALLAGAAAVAIWLYKNFYPKNGIASKDLRTPPSPASHLLAEDARRALQSADRFAIMHPRSTDHIRQYYELVVRHFPDSAEADTARMRLQELAQTGALASLAAASPLPEESFVETPPAPPAVTTSPVVVTGVEEVPQSVLARPPDWEPVHDWGTFEETGGSVEQAVPHVQTAPGSLEPVRTAPVAALRRLFAQGPQRCYIAIACDGRYILSVNGREIGRGFNPAPSRSVGGLSMDVLPCRLKEGDEITVHAEARRDSGALFVEVFIERHGASFGTDSTWQYRQPVAAAAPADDALWRPARIVEVYGGRTWGSPGDLVEPVGNWIWGDGKRLVFRKIVRF